MPNLDNILPDLFNGQYCTRFSPKSTKDIGISQQLIQWHRDGKIMIRESARESNEDVSYTFSLKRKDDKAIHPAQIEEAQKALIELLYVCGIKPQSAYATNVEDALKLERVMEADGDEDPVIYEGLYTQMAQRKAQGEVMLTFRIPAGHLPQLAEAMTDIRAEVARVSTRARA